MDKERIKEIRERISAFNQREEAPKEKIKLLYLDDEKNALVAFKAAFRRSYEIYTTDNADEARLLVEKHEPEVIITDQRMPYETGVEFLTSILKKFPDSIRMLLTGYADIDAVTDAINKGEIYRYISKPYRIEEMENAIENAAEIYRLRKEKEELIEVALQANEQLEFMLRQKLTS